MSLAVMKQALEALEEAVFYTSSESWSPSMTRECEDAITALRAAIEQAQPDELMVWKSRAMSAERIIEKFMQPEQEPVAWVYPEGLEALKSGRPWTAYGSSGGGRIPLYLNDAVARRVEPPAAESGAGFESLPASPQWKGLTNQEALNAAVYVFCQLAGSPEEQKQIARDVGKVCNEPNSALMLFAATIEELLEEKNR